MKLGHCIAGGALWLTLGSAAWATDLVVSGLFSGKALVTINGGNPRMLSVGQTSPEGVKLLSANSTSATFEIEGQKRTLGMGQGISTASGGTSGSKPTLKLVADGGGHFSTVGSINGRPIRMLVDTGATLVAISTSAAKRMGIDLRRANTGAVSTAGGVMRAYQVTFDNVKAGDISLNFVEGTVIDNMPDDFALLGNSFLSRLEMKREGTTLTLTKSY